MSYIKQYTYTYFQLTHYTTLSFNPIRPFWMSPCSCPRPVLAIVATSYKKIMSRNEDNHAVSYWKSKLSNNFLHSQSFSCVFKGSIFFGSVFGIWLSDFPDLYVIIVNITKQLDVLTAMMWCLLPVVWCLCNAIRRTSLFLGDVYEDKRCCRWITVVCLLCMYLFVIVVDSVWMWERQQEIRSANFLRSEKQIIFKLW